MCIEEGFVAFLISGGSFNQVFSAAAIATTTPSSSIIIGGR